MPEVIGGTHNARATELLQRLRQRWSCIAKKFKIRTIFKPLKTGFLGRLSCIAILCETHSNKIAKKYNAANVNFTYMQHFDRAENRPSL